MSYKKFLCNNIFDTQSRIKMTATFLVNKLFYTTTILIYIYTKHLYFDVKPISENSQETSCATASFLLKIHVK